MSQISFCPWANFNSAIPWGLWVAIYVWLVGISAGVFLLVAIGNLKNNLALKKITRLGILLSLSALMVGLLSILVDLGHIERFYKLFISPNPFAPMAWMVGLYNTYFLVLLVALIGLKKGLSKPFWGFSVLFALAVIIVESLLFALPAGKPWHSPLFVLHFFTSSLVSAIAALLFVVGITWVKSPKLELLKGLVKIALPIIVINLGVEIMEMVYRGNISQIENWVLLLGNIIAIILFLKHNPFAITLAAGIGLLGILLSKYNSLISAQMLEPFKGFSRAYIEPRLQFNYFPNFFEYLVGLFLIGAAMISFYILYKVLPLAREE